MTGIPNWAGGESMVVECLRLDRHVYLYSDMSVWYQFEENDILE